MTPDLLLDPDQCAEVLACARGLEPLGTGPSAFPTFRQLPTDLSLIAPVQAALEQLNAQSWGLPRTRWHCTVSSYLPGARFPAHRDFDVTYGRDVPGIVFAASVLLVPGEDFTGGVVVIDGQRMPKIQGAGLAFHSFTQHYVEPITAGHRWALNVFGTLGTIGDALDRGWPDRWLFARDEPAV